MKVCGATDCERPQRTRGYCDMHYRRLLNHGDANAPGVRSQSDACIEAGCELTPIAKDLCRNHYYAAQRAKFRKENPRPSRVVPTCRIDGCSTPAKVRGWCGAHYQRWRRFGDPEFYPPDMGAKCSIDGCDNPTNARGLCSSHYYRLMRYGDPLLSRNKARTTGPIVFAPRACATCGETFEPGRSARRKYCGRRCRPSRSSVGVNSRKTVERLGREDGWLCRICGEAVDSTLYWPNGRAGSVDHIVQVQHGGNDDRENLRLTHLTCNVSRPKNG